MDRLRKTILKMRDLRQIQQQNIVMLIASGEDFQRITLTFCLEQLKERGKENIGKKLRGGRPISLFNSKT